MKKSRQRKNNFKHQKHPSLEIVGSHGKELYGKKIVLCVAGSVAVYKAIELARLLMRHGADVVCVESSAAIKLVKPDYFRWATGNKVITRLTGELEHIRIANFGSANLIIVYPGTANTLGKLANGIDDTPISTVLTVGFGSNIPIVMALAMHQSMYENAAVTKNIEFLRRKKVEFISPKITEDKAKIIEPEEILEFVLRKFGFSSILHNKRILITAGPTIEYVDPVRVITNQSSGKTGILLANEFVSAGAKVTLVYGPGYENPPNGIKTVNVKTLKEMLLAVKNEMRQKKDIVILAAAASDYLPENVSKHKIDSSKTKLNIRLRQAPKIIDQIKKIQKNVFLIGFKAEANVTKKELEKKARRKLNASNADLIIANDIGSKKYRKNSNYNNVLIIDSEKTIESGWKSKNKISRLLRLEIEKRLEKVAKLSK